MRRITLAFLAAGLLLVVSCVGGPEVGERPPNIVLIISDDQAYTDYGFMGHPAVQTPYIDKLARQSAVFTRGYVATSVCRPSLATLITGLYAHEHKITGNDMAPPRERKEGWRQSPEYLARSEALIGQIDKVPTLPRLLAEKGYVSHQSGKWWEGSYARGGFTEGMTHGDPSRGGRHGDDGLKIGREGMKPVLDFIDNAGDRPFFVWYAPFLPHTPHNPPERFLRKYQSAERPEPLARYYAMCEWFDETCGELLAHLDRRDLARDTLVIYITDNGWIQRTSETPVPEGWNQTYAPKSKQSPYEGGARTPVMLRWLGKIEPRRDDETLVSSVDIAPTVLAAGGLGPTGAMTGVNLLEVARGEPTEREAVFGELFAHDVVDIEDPWKTNVNRWCVERRWKLIRNEPGVLGRYRTTLEHRTSDPQLYDLLTDPGETVNVAARHPAVVQRLNKRLNAWWGR